MFEHYMTYQTVDPRFTRMMGVSAIISGMVTLSMVTFAWAANKMDISRVDAPTSDYLVVQLSLEDPPPPPAAPPAAASPAKDDESNEPSRTDEVPDEEPPPEESLAPPSEAPKKMPKLPSGGGGGTSKVPGLPGGRGIGMPGSTIGDPLVPTGLTRKRTKENAPPPKPIQSVMAQGVFTPDPDKQRLAGSKAGMFDKRPCTNRTSFCVDASGKAVDVRTKSKCYDPQVDAIARDAVKRWRFKPFIVAGSPKKTCTTVQFDFKFKE